jgi:hypothetical protein
MESEFLWDVVVANCILILEALGCEDKSLLFDGDSFLIENLSFDGLNFIGWLNIEGDDLSSEGLDEDLHSTSESED